MAKKYSFAGKVQSGVDGPVFVIGPDGLVEEPAELKGLPDRYVDTLEKFNDVYEYALAEQQSISGPFKEIPGRRDDESFASYTRRLTKIEHLLPLPFEDIVLEEDGQTVKGPEELAGASVADIGFPISQLMIIEMKKRSIFHAEN